MNNKHPIYEEAKIIAMKNLIFSLDYQDCWTCDNAYKNWCNSVSLTYIERNYKYAVQQDFRSWDKAQIIMARDYRKRFLENCAFSEDTETYRSIAKLIKDEEWLKEIDRHVENRNSRIFVKEANKIAYLVFHRDKDYYNFIKKKSDYCHLKGFLTEDEIIQFDKEESEIIAIDRGYEYNEVT